MYLIARSSNVADFFFQKSSAERNRKARALKIIAQTKAEMSSEPASSFTDEVPNKFELKNMCCNNDIV